MRRYCLLGFCPLLFLLRSFGQTNSSCTATPAGPVMLCPGGSQVLTASAGTNYRWSTGATTQSITVTKGGNYSVAIDNCQSNTVQVIEAAINPSYPSLCNGSAVLKASGPPEWKTFNWNGPGNFTTATMNIGPYTNVTDLMIGNTNAFVYGDPYRYPKLTFSIDLYNPTTNAWVSVYSGTVYFDAVQLKGLSLSFPNISTVSQIRLSSNGYGYYSIEGFNQVQGTPFTISEHANPFTYLWNTGATTQETTVTETGNYSVSINGCPAVSTTVTGIPGDPAVFGQNAWNVYAWNEGNGMLAGSAWQNNYSGYYTDASFSFATTDKWSVTAAPSDADTYRGCPVGVDNHSWSAKRQGFPCGQYSISVTGHDDAAQLFLDGVKIWEHDGCCDAHTAVWQGYLNAASKIEFRTTEGVGPSGGAVAISLMKPVVTSDSYSTVCPGHPIVLTATTTGSDYLWSTGATTQSITVTQPGVYTIKETDNCGNKIESEPFTASGLVAPETYPSGTVTADACSGYVDLYAYLTNGPYGEGYAFAWYKTGETNPVSTDDYFIATTTGDYYAVVSRNGCSSPPSNTVHVTVPSKGDPSVFGNNVWNVYAWADVNGYPDYYNVPDYQYQGYYTENNLSFDTRNRWNADWGSPADVSGYTGCGYNLLYGDYFKWTAKRKGFTCGRYSISIPAYDDDAALVINGTTVWQSTCCSNAVNPVWEGVLGPDSKVEFTVAEYTASAFGAITFNLLDANVVIKPTVAPAGPVTVCSNSSVTLSSSSPTGNRWSTGATTQTIAVNTAGSYSVTVTGSQGCTAQSDPVQVTVTPAQTWYRDADNDGYGDGTTQTGCTRPAGYKLASELTATTGDCNDNNAAVHAPVTYFKDADGDGYGNAAITISVCAATPPAGYASNNKDCNDDNPAISPTAVEVCGNRVDDNCNGVVDESTCFACQNATALTTTNVTATTAQLNWTATANPMQWQLRYKTIKQGSQWIEVLLTGNVRTATLTALLPNQDYHWQIRAECNGAWTSYSVAVAFKTLSTQTTNKTLSTQTTKAAMTVVPSAKKPLPEAATGFELRLAPNPTRNSFTVAVSSADNRTAVTLQVFDALGRLVETRKTAANVTLALGASYRPGTYYIRVVQGSGQKQGTLIKISD